MTAEVDTEEFNIVNETARLGKLPSLDQLCNFEAFSDVVADFFDFVYPLLPLIHRPHFLQALAGNEHKTSQSFLRLCFALAAVTVASLPRKFTWYSREDAYPSVSAMVDRASQLVQVSRALAMPSYTNSPSTELLVSSLLLAWASHYASRPTQGFLYSSEAIVFTRAMALGERRGYDGVGTIEREIRKRAFWLGYIIQMSVMLNLEIFPS